MRQPTSTLWLGIREPFKSQLLSAKADSLMEDPGSSPTIQDSQHGAASAMIGGIGRSSKDRLKARVLLPKMDNKQSLHFVLNYNCMKNGLKKLLTRLAPILGAGAIGVCPLCWLGSASLLTYLGLGALIPMWRWLAFGLIALGAVGFIFDYRSHKNPRPLSFLILGTVLLYVGRYLFASTWGAWWIWGPGALLIIAAVIYNKSLFRKLTLPPQVQH